MLTRLIFVCHGQLDHEKQNGLKLAELIDGTPGFKAFFAEEVHDTEGLSQHIFSNLERCDGFLAVMHKRGEVTHPGGKLFRASVWVQQELAIVTFLNYLRHAGHRIKVRVFAECGIQREGLADTLILNPVAFDRDEDLPGQVLYWLKGPDFKEDPIATTREYLFQKKTADFTATHWSFLEVMMVFSCGSSAEVSQAQVRSAVVELGVPKAESEAAESDLLNRGLTTPKEYDARKGIQPISIAPAFIDLIADELRRQHPPLPPIA